MNRANERPNADQNKSAAAGTTGTTTPSATDQRAVPKTASPLALYELVSGLAFAGAFGIRQLRNRL